jgi:YD repeat-containing protein
MPRFKWSWIYASSIGLLGAAHAAETTTYTYDALGRLTQTQIAGGPAAGVTRTYQLDSAGNRTQVQVTGAPISATVGLSSIGSISVTSSGGAVIGVNLSGAGSLGGTVTFTENGVYLGSAFIADGQASVFLLGLALGDHTITATYTGDGVHEPHVHTFTVTVRDLSWLPAVLDLLLSD